MNKMMIASFKVYTHAHSLQIRCWVSADTPQEMGGDLAGDERHPRTFVHHPRLIETPFRGQSEQEVVG